MKTYARYFGGLGIIFLIFGAISSLMLRGTLQLVGISEFILGLFGVGIFIFYFLGEALRTISQKREVLYGVLGGLLLLVILIAANVVAHSQFGEKKFDTTANKIHSLSNESAQLIKNLDANIKIIGFFTKAAQQKPFLEDLARKYTYESSKIQFELVDPDENPATLKAYEASPDEVLVRNEKTKKSMKVTTMTEESVTTAIKKVMSTKTRTVYFLEGHAEGGIDDDKTTAGLYIAKILLENEGYSVKSINLASKTEIPADANVVAVWGSQRAVSKSEVDLISHFFERGGSVLVGMNPIVAPTKDKISPSGLEPLLDVAGLEAKAAIILEHQLQLLRGNVINAKIAVTDFGQHQITSGFGTPAVVEVFLSQPVLQKQKLAATNITRTLLASTSKQSWAETNIGSVFVTQKPNPQGKEAGPLPLAQLAELTLPAEAKDKISPKGRLIVFGDANFANNQMIQGGYNRDLFLNSVNYLGGGEEAILSIRPKTWTSSTLEINESQRLVVYFASIFLIPQLIMGLGIVIWLFRRSRA